MTGWRTGSVALTMSVIVVFAGCTSTVRVPNAPGRPSEKVPVDDPGPISSLGIESAEIVSITDQMMRDMLAKPDLAARTPPPRVAIDSRYFRNESLTPLNVNLLTDRLRTELVRAAEGRMVFLGRHYANMTEKERALEEEGVVTGGTQGPTSPALGYDYRLGGRIADRITAQPRTGMQTRYYQITFEMVQRGSGVIVWAKTYEFKKAGQNDITHR